jgi:hypothetical protein
MLFEAGRPLKVEFNCTAKGDIPPLHPTIEGAALRMPVVHGLHICSSDPKVRANTDMDVWINQYRNLRCHAVVAQKRISCGPATCLSTGVNDDVT